MVIGICELTIRIPESRNLKDKRSVVRKIVEKVKARFPVAIAEVDDLDDHRGGKIGFSLVGNDARVLESTIDKVLGYIEELYVANVVAVDREIMHWGEVYD